MALRGKQPEEVKKRLKLFIYGKAGVGKSTLALSFPNPYVIDCEQGVENAQYVALLKANNGALFQTQSFNDVITEVRSLLTEKHDYKTLVIDPLTIIYNNIVDQAAMTPTKDGTDPTAYGRHYVEANRQIKRLLTLLMHLDMNVIITSQSKNEYTNNMTVLGQTFDCYKKLDYLFDLILEVKKTGKRRTFHVIKTRIATFPEDEEIDLSYAEFAKRYDNDVLQSSSKEVQLASTEQLDEFKRLIALLNVPVTTVDGWLTRAKCECIQDMQSDTIDKYIKLMKDKIDKGVQDD